MILDREPPPAIGIEINDPLSEHSDQFPIAGKRNSVFLISALRLVSQRHHFYSSPYRFARILWGFTTNIYRQLEILRIMTSPVLLGLVRFDPILPFKYLTRGYLAGGLTVAERASCLAHHYRQLNARFPGAILRRILYGEVTLLEVRENDNVFAIVLGFSRLDVREGELFLHLQVDGSTIFILQFTIIPGWVVKSERADVLLISRLQGMKGCYRQIHLATKAFQEVAPAALLFATLQGIGQALGIREMAGVCATSQFCYSEDCSASFEGAYDDFWIKLGADKATASFFSIPFRPLEKPLESIKNGHKARTKKKRAFKRQIADAVSRFLQESS